MPVKATRPIVSRPSSIRAANAAEPRRRARGGVAPGLPARGCADRDRRAPAPAHPRVQPNSGRKRRAAAAPRTRNERLSRRASADVDLGRRQLRLRQQRERDRSADRDRLAECRRRQHLDRRAIARPVEPLRHLPDGQQQQRSKRPDRWPALRGQRRTSGRLPRSRRRRASRSRTHRPASVRRCRCRSARRALPSARSTHCRPGAPSAPPASPNGATLRRDETMTAVIGSRKRMRRIAPSPPRHLPCAAGAAADREALQPHRIAQFEHLGVGHPRVGHVGLHRRGAVEARPGAGAAADRFVVLAGRVAEQEVVHRRLRAGDRAERAEQRVAGGLRDLGVAGDHRRARLRREERAAAE